MQPINSSSIFMVACLAFIAYHALSINALNAVKPASLNPSSCGETVGYWGQNSVSYEYPTDSTKWEKPLDQYCQDTTFDIISISFMHIYYQGTPARPGLNFAWHCWNAPFAGYPNLLQCSNIQAGIKACQAKGKKILLTMGGAVSTGQFTDEQAGRDFADTVWKMFMGGSDSAFQRPFGDAKVDGINLNIEAGSPMGYSGFVARLRELYPTDATKVYYVAGSPQCPYPDKYMGPTGSATQYVMGTQWFDYMFVQFYNNYCGIQASGTADFNFNTWHNWAKMAKTKLYLGIPGSLKSAGSGYRPASDVINIVKSLTASYGLAAGGWFSGVAIWDVGSSTMNIDPTTGKSFANLVSSHFKTACAALTSTSTRVTTTTMSTTSRVTTSTTTPRTTITTTTTKPTTTSTSLRTTTTTTPRTTSTTRTTTTTTPRTSTTSRTTTPSTTTSRTATTTTTRSSTTSTARPTSTTIRTTASPSPSPIPKVSQCSCPAQRPYYSPTKSGVTVTRACPLNLRGGIRRTCLKTGSTCRWSSETWNCYR